MPAKLQDLDLAGNGLTDRDAGCLSTALAANFRLAKIRLSENEFGEEAGLAIGAAGMACLFCLIACLPQMYIKCCFLGFILLLDC